MGKPTDISVFMADLQYPLKAEIEAIRRVILGADKRIGEGIKWNAPGFYIDDHFATFKLRPEDMVQVVLHKGAKAKDNSGEVKINDPAGLLKWAAKDRCVASFSNMKDVESKKAAFASIVKQWVKIAV
jgi:hypothetical protein